MAWYEYPNSTQSESLYTLFGYINNTSDGLFMPVILLIVWFISFIGVFSAGGLNKAAGARAFTFSSFLISILSIMATIIGFLSVKFMYLSFVLLAIGVLWLKMQSD